MTAARVKVYRVPRRRSYLASMSELARNREAVTARVGNIEAFLPRDLPEDTVRYLKWLPDDAGETLEKMLDAHGVKPIVGALVQLLRDRGGSDNLFDVDFALDDDLSNAHEKEVEAYRKNCDALAPVMEKLE